MNENTNVYFKARKRAAVYNERLYSREGAAELLGISVSTLADYELGNTKVIPVDKVVLMSDLYKAPELITGYCMNECPVHGFLPLATEEKNIQGIALRLLKGFKEDDLKTMKEHLQKLRRSRNLNGGSLSIRSRIRLCRMGDQRQKQRTSWFSEIAYFLFKGLMSLEVLAFALFTMLRKGWM